MNNRWLSHTAAFLIGGGFAAICIELIFRPLNNFDTVGSPSKNYIFPTSYQILQTPSFICLYDYRLRAPVWVAEYITKESVTKAHDVHRWNNFYSETRLPLPFRTSNSDYTDSGWSRGHLAPAALHVDSQESMNATFSLANIVPQEMSMNGCDWARLEYFVHDLASKNVYKGLHVISGPLWLPDHPSNSHENNISFILVGKRMISVPTHLFKVVIAETANSKEKPDVAAFVMPNNPITVFKNLSDFQVSLPQLETQAGMELSSRLPQGFGDLCKKTGCDSKETPFQSFWRFYGRLKVCRDDEVEGLWAIAVQKGYSHQSALLKLYKQRTHQLPVISA